VVKTPVDELYASGYVALSDVEEILLLKSDQSEVERRPRAEADAVGSANVKVPDELVIPKSVPEVEVAKVIAPVCAEPYVCATESTPVFVTFPAEYVRPEENVVVATHDGIPLLHASICPAVPWVVVATAPVPFPYGMAPA
jgi:hypothetical protein